MHSVAHGFELGMFEISFDKWHLGVVRIIDFAAVAVLLDPLPIRDEAVGNPAACAHGAGWSAGVLRAPVFLFRRTCHHARCSDGKRLARSGIGGDGFGGHVANGADVHQKA